MKYYLAICLVLICATEVVWGQAVIVKNDASTIKAYNIEIGDTRIFYQLSEEETDIFFSVKKSDVLIVKMEDGSKYDPDAGDISRRKAISNQMSGLFNNNGSSNSSAGYGNYDLGGRGMIGSLPRPEFNKNISGTMVVTIWVDSEGRVKEAHAGARGSTISDMLIRVACEKAAMNAKFAKTENKGLTQGSITYYFDVNN